MMPERDVATRLLSRYLARPTTLREICEAGGREEAYERVRLALNRWETGKGRGLSEQDCRWVLSVLQPFIEPRQD